MTIDIGGRVISELDWRDVLKASFDEATNRLKTETNVEAVVAGGTEVIISQEDDSIRIGDGSDLVTTHTVDGSVGLDVNVVGGVIGSLKKDMKTTAVTVTDVATKIPASALLDRSTLTARVIGTEVVYFGGDDVSVVDGYPKYRYEEVSMDVKDTVGVELWAICEPGKTCEVRVWEIS